ncbi:hypothetical protein TPB0596_39840 [Tsukamurella pulmonis]|uniref:DUF2516 domain-containing protein n=2 Tax=Tsukamurella pulmonis TaxID=47312 RepID=A0A1H1BZJ4_9ACTN|nr:DUF2516 family protein [Tsukamurella pulmonis]KXO90129.1 hypothetical protein AXK56_08370 [Tsukamurella pulmonis]KXP11382.1 hypothetical protein AXK57_08600 [Tsukamurella pulmonis]SDQ57299.1 Protein of unknown function [Tsukamurella pulmonis]SUP24447.1 Protein of uncharacterised function (DUF2516) [Tsukamurella pulmonis]BDD84221.1 hypothetical protein TPB0596_39840 [Tsukamurella pulmonis]
MDVFLTGLNTASALAYLVITLALLAAAVFSLIHALRAPADAFTAAGKWQKKGWTLVLLLCLLLVLAGLNYMGTVLGAIGILVYLLDVKPKLDEVRRPGY